MGYDARKSAPENFCVFDPLLTKFLPVGQGAKAQAPDNHDF